MAVEEYRVQIQTIIKTEGKGMRLPLDPILQLWMDVRGDKKDEAYFWEALVQISPAYAVGFIEQVRPMVTNEKLDSLKQILNIGHPRQ